MLNGILAPMAPGNPAGGGYNTSGSSGPGAADFAEAVASVPRDTTDTGGADHKDTPEPDVGAETDHEADSQQESQENTVGRAKEGTPARGFPEGLEPTQKFRGLERLGETLTGQEEGRIGLASQKDSRDGHVFSTREAAGAGSTLQIPTDHMTAAVETNRPKAAGGGSTIEGMVSARFTTPEDIARADSAKNSTSEKFGKTPTRTASEQLAGAIGPATGSSNPASSQQFLNGQISQDLRKSGQTKGEAAAVEAPPVPPKQRPLLQPAPSPARVAQSQFDSANPAFADGLISDGEIPSKLFSRSGEDLFLAQTRLEAASLGTESAREVYRSGQSDAARAIATQINDVLVRRSEGRFELALNPEELGRVRVTMKPGDGVMTLAIVADRPETLDLMRRHIDQLASEFRDMGYGSVHVDLSGAEDGEGHSEFGADAGTSLSDEGDMDASESALSQHPATNRDLPTGLDMRL